MQRTRFLIIGGGITGLAFAQSLTLGDYAICEALDDVGGYCRTIKRDGFVWDFSGHFFHFRHAELERELVQRIGPEKVRRVVKDARIYYAGELIDFPFQKNIHQLPREEFLQCLVDLFEREPGEPQNFEQMLYMKFGRSIAEKFLVPYQEKLYATALNRLDVGAMGRFFPHADAEDIVRGFKKKPDGGYNATFTYPEGGAYDYVLALKQGIPEERILLEEPVLELDLSRRVARTSRREIGFEYVLSSLPFPRLLELCRLPFDASVYTQNKVLVFNLGFDAKGPQGIHWIYYPQRDLSFYRVGFYDNIFDTPRMSLYVELGYPSDAVLDAATIDATRERVLADLRTRTARTPKRTIRFEYLLSSAPFPRLLEAVGIPFERSVYSHNKVLVF
ncbi:MAG: FAD-dependent oxidoreductase, partial [Polyangiaceae bacterium]